jgi:hypothetical protein
MPKVTIENAFIYAGHTMNIEISDYSEFQNPFASSADNFPLVVVSVSSVPIFEEDGTPLGTYPQNFAEGEARLFLNECYDEKTELDTLEVFIYETKQAINKNVSFGTFEKVSV